ncbi:uncharacterized protein BYT42DRAFT_559540 [Radiomyces spectabilis]|uniref:uncharacterized protein n=1 Tax=Radiomyces spectabilis TaxID=64574 RepID=UPI002220E5B0|nr:uncharacterized protein BYT42DRAFT_559540 [Radiomyces spectabilis]KAI8388272.1 hypothetical protein BYT42DRAFT_559540 [Radiomyces spectabilis]
MIQLTDYGERIVDRLNMIGMWLAVFICVRNFVVCYRQYQRTRGKIHLANIAQVVVFFVHRFLYGLIPLFEITTCAYYPLLVSLWHLDYILFYTVMFMRLIILESDRHSLWIKIVSIALITIRFADWPYELVMNRLEQHTGALHILGGAQCWAAWSNGVIILNFVADIMANLFLSGMFVRRLYMHIRKSRDIISRHNRVIEQIARKSLLCLIFTFVANLAMNLLKITRFIGDHSDAFTVYFEIIESTLLVEALRVDYTGLPNQAFCENCGMAVRYTRSGSDRKQKSEPDYIGLAVRGPSSQSMMGAPYTPTSAEHQTASLINSPIKRATFSRNSVHMFDHATAMEETVSAPALGTKHGGSPTTPKPSLASDSALRSIDPTSSFASLDQSRRLTDRPEWSNNDYRMF